MVYIEKRPTNKKSIGRDEAYSVLRLGHNLSLRQQQQTKAKQAADCLHPIRSAGSSLLHSAVFLCIPIHLVVGRGIRLLIPLLRISLLRPRRIGCLLRIGRLIYLLSVPLLSIRLRRHSLLHRLLIGIVILLRCRLLIIGLR